MLEKKHKWNHVGTYLINVILHFLNSYGSKQNDDISNCVAHVFFTVPNIEIIGESDIHVKAGSTVSIKCVITQSLEEPAYIFWYHNERRVLDYDHNEKDIKTERLNHDTTVGTLTIFHATSENAGNYTCSPSNLDSASVLLHVLNGLY